ncbi:hypothetical protein F0U61_39070 [Archangium violaceum]|uniref:hypothetical protein n=1 Tax=Archangium violaceum TaxID=83451 RepID=UPI002B2B1337|nr:hypothetical protein F0U61_39070 [Archangium violaceum]
MDRQPATGAFFDDSLWPLLIVRLVGQLSHAQFEAYLERMRSYLLRGERHLFIMDTSQSRSTSVDGKRRLQADWMDANEALLREWRLGTAFVIRSPFLGLAMRAFLHAKPLVTPYVVVSNLHEAAAWAAGRFEEAGLPLQAGRIREHFGLGVSSLEHSAR